MSEIPDPVEALAVSYIDRALRSGQDVTIPSLGVVIKGDKMVQLWSDLTPEEQARYEDQEQLLAQLATAGQRNAELAETLHRRNAKIAAQAQRIQELEQQLALVEHFAADQWRNGNAGREPQEWDEWRQEQAEDRRAAFNGGEI